MFRTTLARFAIAAALLSSMPAVADDAQTITQLREELRITREQLAVANSQVASSIAAATIQLQDLQRQVVALTKAPAAAPPEKK